MNKEAILYVVVSAVAVGVGAFVFWGPSTGNTRRRKVPVVGLRNLGFTCFLNALLQALASCPLFIEWLELNEYCDSISRSVANVLRILSNEAESYANAYSPLEVISSLRRNGWSISPGEQDAHELFHHLILTIEEESLKEDKGSMYGCLSDALLPATLMPPNVVTSTKSLPSAFVGKGDLKRPSPFLTTVRHNGDISNVDISEKGDLPLHCRSKYDLNRNLKQSPFTGFLTSQTCCTECGFKSVLRYDKFDSLSLHLPPLELGRVQHTLTQLLDRFVKTEVVGGVSCEGCNKSTPPEGPQIKSTALKSLSIGKLPRCLCIHIPRTLIHNGEPYKRQDYVDFPEFLGMDPYTQYNLRDLRLKKQPLLELSKNDGDKNLEASLNNIKSRKMNHVYRIKAVIVHKGSLKGGHFVTYRRGPLKSHKRHRLNQTHQSHGERRWYLTSDADVRDATLSEALQSTAYMLFYEKCYQESSVTWSSVSLRTS